MELNYNQNWVSMMSNGQVTELNLKISVAHLNKINPVYEKLSYDDQKGQQMIFENWYIEYFELWNTRPAVTKLSLSLASLPQR